MLSKNSQTYVNDFIWLATTCLQKPSFGGTILKLYGYWTIAICQQLFWGANVERFYGNYVSNNQDSVNSIFTVISVNARVNIMRQLGLDCKFLTSNQPSKKCASICSRLSHCRPTNLLINGITSSRGWDHRQTDGRRLVTSYFGISVLPHLCTTDCVVNEKEEGCCES